MAEKTVVLKPFRAENAKKDTEKTSLIRRHAISCPSCTENLLISELSCPLCKVSVRGSFPQNPFSQLSPEDQTFLVEFTLCGGRLKDLCSRLGKSYPTMRKRLDSLISQVREVAKPLQERADKRKRILEMLERKQVSLEAAEEILNKLL